MDKIKGVVDVISSTWTSSASLWRGTNASPVKKQPEQLLELYEYEYCPYCRLVREVLTELDLDALIYPCPVGGERYRPVMEAAGGKQQYPYLVDPNTGESLYESQDIIAYLYKTYKGKSAAPRAHKTHLVGSYVSTLSRGFSGKTVRPSKQPEQPLVLYSFESSPFSRLVREKLCELELPYILRNTGKASMKDLGPPIIRKVLFPDLPVSGRNRIEMMARAGKVQVPYLIDPNTNTEMFESEEIVDYLLATYAL
jgi:glutathione S-transferase